MLNSKEAVSYLMLIPGASAVTAQRNSTGVCSSFAQGHFTARQLSVGIDVYYVAALMCIISRH